MDEKDEERWSDVRACCVDGLHTDVDVERQGMEVPRVPGAASVQGAEGDDDGEVEAPPPCKESW